MDKNKIEERILEITDNIALLTALLENADEEKKETLEKKIAELQEELEALQGQLEETIEAEMSGETMTIDEIIKNLVEFNYDTKLEELEKTVESLEKVDINKLGRKELEELISAINKVTGDLTQSLSHVDLDPDFKKNAENLKERLEKVHKNAEEIHIKTRMETNAEETKTSQSETKKEGTEQKRNGTSSESTETKTTETNNGSFGEVVSCMFGQVDKRLSNWWYNDESKVLFGKEKRGDVRYERAVAKRNDRYENLGSHFLKNAILTGVSSIMFTSLVATGFAVGGPIVIGLAPVLGVMGVTGITKCVGDLVRKIGKKGPKPVIRNKEILEGSWTENLKNAFKKFGRSKQKANNKQAKVTNNPVVEEKNEVDINKIRSTIDEFVQAVKDGKREEATTHYETLRELCGDKLEEMVSKEVLEAYNNLIKKVDDEEEFERVETTEKEVDTLKLTKLTNYIIGFELKPTMESIKECQELIQQIFSLNEEERKVLHANTEVWSKVKFLMKKSKEYCERFKHLKNNDILSVFIKIVETFDFKGEEIKYDRNQLMVCMNIYNRLSDAEKALIPENIMIVYRDALRFDSIFTLQTKLSMLDIEKCIRENNYDEIFECCYIYDRYMHRKNDNNDVSHKRKLGREGIEKFPQKLRDKLNKILEIRENYKKRENSIYGNARFSVNYEETEINGRTINVALVTVEVDGDVLEEFAIPLTENSSYVDQVISGITKKHPFVEKEQIEIEELVTRKGNAR